MDSFPQERLHGEIAALQAEEERLAARARETEDALSGLKELETLLALARVRLSLCMRLMEKLSAPAGSGEKEELSTAIRDKALSAFRIVEGLLAENVSEDQRDAVSRDPAYAPVKELLERFIVSGGGGFLEDEASAGPAPRLLARSLVAAIRKYAGEDDLYPPLMLEDYPPFVQSVLRALFPILIHEHPQQPPYGIDEGEETTHSSPRMKLPLSQAVHYLENVVLPELRRKLGQSPGDSRLQAEIAETERTAEEYRRLRFFPRSTPVLLEQNFHTQGMSFYTPDGELLVPIPLPVTMRSGTNLDRKMELVRAELVRRLAGRGVSPELDREYRRLRSLESGIRGSSRTASLKLDASWGFRVLKQGFPALSRLEEKQAFRELAEAAMRGSAASSQKRVSALLEAERPGVKGLPGITGTSQTDPS
jgi:hypothetical protein